MTLVLTFLFVAWNIFNSYVYGYRMIAFQKYCSPNITCKTVGWTTDGVGQGVWFRLSVERPARMVREGDLAA
jgi:hypothetical protein